MSSFVDNKMLPCCLDAFVCDGWTGLAILTQTFGIDNVLSRLGCYVLAILGCIARGELQTLNAVCLYILRSFRCLPGDRNTQSWQWCQLHPWWSHTWCPSSCDRQEKRTQCRLETLSCDHCDIVAKRCRQPDSQTGILGLLGLSRST